MYCVHVRIPVPNPFPSMPITFVNVATYSAKSRRIREWVFVPKYGMQGEVYNVSICHDPVKYKAYAGGCLDTSLGESL